MQLEGAAKRFYRASVAAAQRSQIIVGVVGILAGLAALGAGMVYVDLETKRVQAEADTAIAKAEAALALAREEKAKADRARAITGQTEAEKREAEAKAMLNALKVLQRSLAFQAKASPSAAKEPTALDSSVVHQLDEYLVKQERENAKLPEPLEDLLRETENIPPPVVEPGLNGPVTALPQPRGGPVARSVVLGEAYSKLSQAKVVAASCKRRERGGAERQRQGRARARIRTGRSRRSRSTSDSWGRRWGLAWIGRSGRCPCSRSRARRSR